MTPHRTDRPPLRRRLAAAGAVVAVTGLAVALGPAAGAAPGEATDPAPDAVEAAPRAATTTELVASASSVEAGQQVTLTAVVETGGVPVTTGTVEFFDGATSVGTADLNALGEASRNATFATVGARSLTAQFLGTGGDDPSTSAAVALTVTAAEPPTEPPTEPPSSTPRGTGVGTGPAGQTLTVTPVDELDPDGTEVQVTGQGFTAAAGFDIATEGMYIALCVDQGPGATPSPCVGGADMEGTSGSSSWVTNNPYDGVPPEAVTAVQPDGSFQVTLTLSARDEFVDCLDLPDGQRCVLATRMDHRASADRSQDVKVALCWAGEPACTTEPIPPADPTTPPPFTGYQLTTTTGTTRRTAGTLAATGGDTSLLPWGLGLVAGGAALLLASRRSRRSPDLVPVPPTGGAPS